MRRWFANKVHIDVASVQDNKSTDKLRRLNEEVMRRYQREVSTEVGDPTRLAAVYGSAFSTGTARQQAHTVALTATSMLKVPNCEVTVVYPDRQESVAAVNNYAVIDPGIGNLSYEDSWCKNVIATGREFAVDNAGEHTLVCDTTLTTEGGVGSYLGVPIADRTGIIIGVLCVFDSIPRDWTPADVSMLSQLSFVLTRAMELPGESPSPDSFSSSRTSNPA